MKKHTKDRRGRTLLNRLDVFVDVAREASSRGAAFLYALCGIIAQIAHNALLAYDVSLFENEYLKIGQAVIVAMAVSFALMYFVLTTENKKTYSTDNQTIYTFFVLEVFLNTMYYLKKIVADVMYAQVYETGSWSNLNWVEPNWFMLLIGLPFAFFIPFIIKSYAGNIKAHEPPLSMDDDDFVKSDVMSKELQTFRSELDDIAKLLKEAPASEQTSALTDEQILLLETVNKEMEQLKSTVDEERSAMNIDEMRDKFAELREQFEASITAKSSAFASQLKPLMSKVEKYGSTVDVVNNRLSVIDDANKNVEHVTQLNEELREFEKAVGLRLSELKKQSLRSGDKVILQNGEKQQPFVVRKEANDDSVK